MAEDMGKKSMKWVKVAALLLFLCVTSYLTLAYLGVFGHLETAGEVSREINRSRDYIESLLN